MNKKGDKVKLKSYNVLLLYLHNKFDVADYEECKEFWDKNGNNNFCIGYNAGHSNTTGNNNTFIGGQIGSDPVDITQIDVSVDEELEPYTVNNPLPDELFEL